MRSNASPSKPSADPTPRRRRRGWATWPEDLLLPVLIATMQTLAITPLLLLFLGEDFGLSGGRAVMWPGGLALLGLAGFGMYRFVSRLTDDPKLFQAAIGIGWLIAVGIWFGLEPVYDLRAVLAEPSSLVGSRGYLVAPLLLSLGIWWQGIRYATVDFLMSSEEIRGTTQRSWLVLIGSLVFAALLDNDAGTDALASAAYIIPLAMIASVALVAAAEVHLSRREIRQSGGRAPTWARWSRLVSGVGVGILLVVVMVTLLLTPGAFAALMAGLIYLAQVAGQIVMWVLYAIFYLIYYLIYAVTELLRALFGLDMTGMQQPEAPPVIGGDQMQFEQREEGEPWPYAWLLRWALLAIVVLGAILILFRMARRLGSDKDDGIGDEERSSVFSTDLAKQQLRDLLRRRNRGSRIPTLNLDAAPASVRESWSYLQVLAIRQDVGRRDAETPQDFSARLRAVWPGTAAALNDLAKRYERSRYGDLDSDRDRDAAVESWADIYRRRRDVEIERREE